jgi:hypothetical protein
VRKTWLRIGSDPANLAAAPGKIDRSIHHDRRRQVSKINALTTGPKLASLTRDG